MCATSQLRPNIFVLFSYFFLTVREFVCVCVSALFLFFRAKLDVLYYLFFHSRNFNIFYEYVCVCVCGVACTYIQFTHFLPYRNTPTIECVLCMLHGKHHKFAGPSTMRTLGIEYTQHSACRSSYPSPPKNWTS